MYPFSIRFEPGESVRGYLHRLASEHGYPCVQWIVTDLGMQNINNPIGESQLKRLAGLSGTSIADLAGHREALNGDRQLFFQGEIVGNSVIDREASRICLPCFREKAFHRLAWDVSALTLCPVHGVPIIRRCPECGIVLGWRRRNFHKCSAGHDLLDHVSRAQPIASGSALAGLQALYERVQPNLGPASHLGTLPAEIRMLPLRDFINVLETIGYINHERQRRNRRDKHSAGMSPDHHLALGRGFKACQNWPDAFHEILDAIPGQDRGLKIADVRCPERRSLHILLQKQDRPTLAQIIGREIWSYAGKRGVTLSPGAFGYAPEGFETSYITSTSARAKMNVSMEVLRRIASINKWTGARQLLTHKNAWLRRADIDSWLETSHGGQTARRLSRRFHVMRNVILEMAQRGLFGEQAINRRPLQARHEWHALPREVDCFLSRFRASIGSVTDREYPFYVNWNAFSKRPESKRVSFAAVVEGIVNGSIRAVEIQGEDLTTLRFHIIDAIMLAARVDGVTEINERMIPFPIGSIKRHYGVSHFFLARAIKLRLLPVRRIRSSPAFWLTYAEVDALLERYTTLGIAAKRLSVSMKTLSWALRQSGVRPYYQSKAQRKDPSVFTWEGIRNAETLLRNTKSPTSGRRKALPKLRAAGVRARRRDRDGAHA